MDRLEKKNKAKKLARFYDDEKESDCILQGYIKKRGNSFASGWQTKYAKLYPNRFVKSSKPIKIFLLTHLINFRLELLPLSRNNKPELIFMDQIEEVAADVPYKNESSIQIKLKDNIQRIILYNQVR